MEGGDVVMLNIPDWRSVAEGGSVCSLAEILEPSVASKYSLSPKACSGILRRAAKRGKKLPPMLLQALQAVAGASNAPEKA